MGIDLCNILLYNQQIMIVQSREFAAFNEKQNNIYGNFHTAQEQITENGLEVDGGTAKQSAFLVAWRIPENTARIIGEFSEELNAQVPSVVYGRTGTVDNAHVTLSDYKLVKGEHINPDADEAQAVLAGLVAATRQGINRAGLDTLQNTEVEFGNVLHNGKTGIIAGHANPGLFVVRQAVIGAAKEGDIELGGAWGAHSTVSRVLEAQEPASSKLPGFMDTLSSTRNFGAVRPSSLDVGYFASSPEGGFEFTPVERFDVASGTQISMYTPGK